MKFPLYYKDSITTFLGAVSPTIQLNVQVPDEGTLAADTPDTQLLLEVVLFGKCDDKDCTYKLDRKITANAINEGSVIFDQDSFLFDLNSFDGTGYDTVQLDDILVSLQEPLLKIRLVDQLIDDDNGSIIPYLEYKLTTNVPISYPAYEIYIKATVEENTFIREEEVDYPRNVLDAVFN